MKSILTTIAFFALAVSGLAQTRSVIVNTSGVVQSPTNFWSADVTNARSGLGLGTAATNPASAFQPSSLALSNLVSSNGGALTNLTAANITGTVALASNVTGTIAISNGGSGATTAVGARTNFGLGAIWLTNTVASNFRTAVGLGASDMVTFGIINANLLSVAGSNIDETGIISGGGFYISDQNTTNTNAVFVFDGDGSDRLRANARTNLGLGWSALTNSNEATSLLGFTTNGQVVYTGTNTLKFTNLSAVVLQNGPLAVSEIQDSSGNSIFMVNDQYFVNVSANDGVALDWGGSSVIVGLPISFAASSNAATTRTNLGLPLAALTNTNTSNFRTSIGLGATNTVFFNTVSVKERVTSSTTLNGIQWQNMYPSSNGLIGLYGSDAEGTTTFGINIGTMSGATTEIALFNLNRITFYEPLVFNNTTNAATTRTNLGLGWSALTNINTSGLNASLYGSGTNPVLYSTNGEVVSPTNFWQVAPIVTRFVEFDPSTNATTNIVAARNLHIHSLAISRTGVTSTIALPITNSFNGDIALVVHKGPTSSVTAARMAGAATNLVTMNQPEQTIEFVYYNNVWQFNHNRSFVEPIFFSGTNAAGHAEESRTNLGLPLAALTNTNNANFQAAVFATNTTPTNAGNFNTHAAWMEVTVQTNGSNVSFRIPLYK